MDVRHYYDQYWSKSGFHPDRIINPGLEVLFNAHIPSSAKLIDVGCGNASVCGRWFEQRGNKYIGVDVSALAVDEANEAGLNVRRIYDASDLPYDDKTFDAAICLEMFEHLFQPEKAAREIIRVLKPGGLLIATVPNVAYWRRRFELLWGVWNPLGDDLSIEQPWRDPHVRFFTRSSLRRMLVSAGFSPAIVGAHSSEYSMLVANSCGLRRLFFKAHSSHIYCSLENKFPSLFGFRIHAVALKPASAL